MGETEMSRWFKINFLNLTRMLSYQFQRLRRLCLTRLCCIMTRMGSTHAEVVIRLCDGLICMKIWAMLPLQFCWAVSRRFRLVISLIGKIFFGEYARTAFWEMRIYTGDALPLAGHVLFPGRWGDLHCTLLETMRQQNLCAELLKFTLEDAMS